MTQYCPTCQTANRDAARFCSGCGLALSSSLPQIAPAPSYRPPVPPATGAALPTGRLAAMSILNNRYRIVQKRAQGGMAAVYEAVDLALPGKRWAIKEMSHAQIAAPAQRQQAIAAFKREAQMLATLDHPNLPKVVDFFSQGGREYLVMEYIDSQTLRDVRLAPLSRPRIDGNKVIDIKY